MDRYVDILNSINKTNSNKFINVLLGDKKYLINRLGNVEFNACRGNHLKDFPSKNIIKTHNSIDQYMRKNAGFYFKSNSVDEQNNLLRNRDIFYIWQNKYLNSVFKSDFVLVYKHHHDDFIKIFKTDTNVIEKINYEIFFEDINFYLYLFEYYTFFKQKKILIISHFTDTMSKQLNLIDKILFSNSNKLSKFNVDFFIISYMMPMHFLINYLD